MIVDKNRLLEFLQEVDNSLNYKVTLIALGGSALSLLGLKQRTEDIDLIFITDNEEGFRDLCKRISKDEYKMHLMQDFTVSHMNLPDYINRSRSFREVNFKNLDIRTLDIYDIILTKIDRSLESDLDDIEAILEKEEIKKDELERRYKECFYDYLKSIEKGQFKKRYEEFKKLYEEKLK